MTDKTIEEINKELEELNKSLTPEQKEQEKYLEPEERPKLGLLDKLKLRHFLKKYKKVLNELETGKLAKTETQTRERLIQGILLHQTILIIEDEEDGQPLTENKLRNKTTKYLINTTKEILQVLEEVA